MEPKKPTAEELKQSLEVVFALARQQKVNSDPTAENDLIVLINLKKDVFEALDKAPEVKK